MATGALSAGIYQRELDQSLYAPEVATVIFGVVGGAHKGEKDTVVRVSSQAEYVSKFGEPTTPMGRAMMQYLRFGHEGKVVRVARSDAYATVEVDDAGGTKTFDVRSKTTGEDFNGVLIIILSSVGTGDFRLVVEKNGYPVETWDGLTKTNMEEVLNDGTTGSEYIVVTNDGGNANPPQVSQTYELVGGSSGVSGLIDADYIGTKVGSVTTGLQSFDNPEEIECDLLAVPGQSSSPIITAIITLCETRADVYGLVDSPYGLDVDEIIQFHNGEGAWSGQHAALNTSYACCDWPWHKVFDAYTNQEEWISASGVTAGLIAYNDLVADPWWAAAGLTRARAINSLAIEYSPTLEERHRLYAYNNINPYVNFQADGIIRWGQKTLLRAPRALNRENVRRMLHYAEKRLGRVLRYIAFDPNDKKTWNTVINLSDAVLAPIQARRGLYDYRVICDETTTTPELIDQNTLLAKMLLKPTKTAEVIRVDWSLLSTGARFQEFI